MSAPHRSPLVIATVAVLVVGLAVLWRYQRSAGHDVRSAATRATRDAVSRTGAAQSPSRAGAPEASAPDTASDGADAAAAGEEPEDMQTPWSVVDLEALRKELPDNLYWKMASPTSDPAVIAAREAERERWNVEYGKVLSNTATADEVDAYYAYRYRLSSDYVQFATFLLSDYGDDLAPRDVGLLKVAIELNLARLEEIPRQITEAHARREAHDAARRAWLESERAFKSGEK
jgi:hypothetical protein